MLLLNLEEAAAALAAARIAADPAGVARRVRRALTKLDIALAREFLGQALDLVPEETRPEETREEFLRELRRNS